MDIFRFYLECSASTGFCKGKAIPQNARSVRAELVKLINEGLEEVHPEFGLRLEELDAIGDGNPCRVHWTHRNGQEGHLDLWSKDGELFSEIMRDLEDGYVLQTVVSLRKRKINYSEVV